MRHIKALAVFAGVLTCATIHMAQAGDVYKYVDERGTTLYTDKPIPGAVLVSTGAQRPPEVAARTNAANQAASSSQLSASNQRIAESKDNARVAANVAKDVGAEQAERCKEARAHYQTTITSARLYKENSDGQRVYLNSTETDQARADASRKVEAICGPQG